MKKHILVALSGSIALAAPTAYANSISAGFLWSPKGKQITIIAGDDIPDPINVFPIRVSAPNFTFVITDSESTVLAYSENNIFDLDGAGEGTCRIYGFAWSGEFDFPTGVPVAELRSSEESVVSYNRISIKRLGHKAVDGGIVLNDSRGRAPIRLYLDGDSNPFRVYALSKASTDTNYAYVITDEEGMVLAFPEGNVIDLSGAPPGICRVYGISFVGELDRVTGVHVSELSADSGEQSLSHNSIRVDRLEGSKPGRRSRR